MLTLKAFGKALEIGPKVFCPSVELCDSLEQLDINVPLADFRLPFPTCFVEYPRPWADQLASALLKEGHPQAGRVPWFSMVAQTDPDRYISSISFRDSRPGEYNGIVVTDRGEDLFQLD